MKNKLKILTIIMCIICLCGCSNKKDPITSEQFLAPLEESFSINDITNNYSFAKESYIATYQTTEIKLIYTKAKSTYEAKSVFADEVVNTLTQIKNKEKYSTSKGDNWEKLVVANDSNYFYLIRVNDTYIYSTSTLESKDYLRKILKEYGYR